MILHVNKYNIVVISFRFKAKLGRDEITGGATPLNNEVFPEKELKEFIYPAKLIGIYQVYGLMKVKYLIGIQDHPLVLLVDPTEYIIRDKFKLDTEEVIFDISDLYWYYRRFG